MVPTIEHSNVTFWLLGVATNAKTPVNTGAFYCCSDLRRLVLCIRLSEVALREISPLLAFTILFSKRISKPII
jgi:hypothetical protein